MKYTKQATYDKNVLGKFNCNNALKRESLTGIMAFQPKAPMLCFPTFSSAVHDRRPYFQAKIVYTRFFFDQADSLIQMDRFQIDSKYLWSVISADSTRECDSYDKVKEALIAAARMLMVNGTETILPFIYVPPYTLSEFYCKASTSVKGNRSYVIHLLQKIWSVPFKIGHDAMLPVKELPLASALTTATAKIIPWNIQDFSKFDHSYLERISKPFVEILFRRGQRKTIIDVLGPRYYIARRHFPRLYIAL